MAKEPARQHRPKFVQWAITPPQSYAVYLVAFSWWRDCRSTPAA
jgi:hypothetical protein